MNNQRSDLIDQKLLKKYIIYARRFMKPKLSEIDQNKIAQFYADIRRESNLVGGIPIAVRHIESVIRMSESWAKLHLRDYVRSDDIDHAIEMLLDSFLQSQKNSVSRQLGKKFEKYRARKQDSSQLLMHQLKKQVNDRAQYDKVLQKVDYLDKIEVRLPKDLFENEVRDLGAYNLTEFYNNAEFRK